MNIADYDRIYIILVCVVIYMIDTVYSIGYSGFLVDEFVNILEYNGINLLVDVRSQPYSQYYSDYNKDSFELKLKNKDIYYRNYANEFGARQDQKEYYSNEGFLDFELFAKSPQFLEGMEKLKNSMLQNYKFVVMCAEKDPFNCHRAILVTRAFHDAGFKIMHLLPAGEAMTQTDIEKRLLEKYYPQRDQLSFFEQHYSTNDYIKKAYKKRNAEIGYSNEEEGH